MAAQDAQTLEVLRSAPERSGVGETSRVYARVFAVWFKELVRWDTKFFSSRLDSKYSLASLELYVREHNEKVNLFEFPDQTFRILGVDNVSGVFHAYDTLGKKINQPYKKVNANDFVYNPYRVNVGSIGTAPDHLASNFASPAYIVFAVDETRLVPKLLELILKSKWFNPMLRAATAGSVRQNLTFELLQTLEIPLPPLDVQRAIVARWQQAQADIAAANERAEQLEAEIPLKLYEALGTLIPTQPVMPKYMVLQWKEVERWSFNYIARVRQGLIGFTRSKYPIVPLRQCITDTTNGYCIKPVTGPTPHQMLKLNALTPAGLDLQQTKYVKVSEQIAKNFSIHKGDLMICRSVGSYDHVAKCAVVEQDHPNILFPDIMIRVLFNESALPEYVREVIQTPIGRSYFQSNARTSVGMWKIGAEDIREFPIPLPPLNVQRDIMQRIEAGRAEIARVREQAQRRASLAETEIEALILGTKKL